MIDVGHTPSLDDLIWGVKRERELALAQFQNSSFAPFPHAPNYLHVSENQPFPDPSPTPVPKPDRMAIIAAKVRHLKATPPFKPTGMNAAEKPWEATGWVAKKPWKDTLANPNRKAHFNMGHYESLEVKNTNWLCDWEGTKPLKLGERRARKTSPLVKIMRAKPVRLERVPPWQRKK